MPLPTPTVKCGLGMGYVVEYPPIPGINTEGLDEIEKYVLLEALYTLGKSLENERVEQQAYVRVMNLLMQVTGGLFILDDVTYIICIVKATKSINSHLALVPPQMMHMILGAEVTQNRDEVEHELTDNIRYLTRGYDEFRLTPLHFVE